MLERSAGGLAIKRTVKAVVTWPPLNAPVTSAVRSVLPAAARNRPFLARYLPRAGPVVATLPTGGALRMWSRGDDDIATTLFWRGWDGHEPETAGPFLDLAASARTTLDIGAHVGYFTMLAALANPAGRVYAFEPLARVRERLARNVEMNGLENVACVPLAVGATEGVAQLFHVPDGIPSSSSLSAQFMRSIVDGARVVGSEVEVTTVDRFVEENGLVGTVDLVKIDTENTEDEVFRGMVDTLRTSRPTIFCEVLRAETGRAIEAVLGPLGYEFHLLTGDGPMAQDHLAAHPTWRNHLFVPTGAQ